MMGDQVIKRGSANAIDEDDSGHALRMNFTALRRGEMACAGAWRRPIRTRAPIGTAPTSHELRTNGERIGKEGPFR